MVEQRPHLASEQRHRVEPQVLRPVGAPVAEQVDADHPVAAFGQRRPEALLAGFDWLYRTETPRRA